MLKKNSINKKCDIGLCTVNCFEKMAYSVIVYHSTKMAVSSVVTEALFIRVQQERKAYTLPVEVNVPYHMPSWH